MENLEQLKRMLAYERAGLKKRIEQVEEQLKAYADVAGSIVIKKINGKPYYYLQWTADGKLCSRSLGAVKPGSVAKEERRLQEKRALKDELAEKKELLEELDKSLKSIKRQCAKKRILKDYTFEVYWKDEITARVYVRGADVTVSRFTEHPLRQLFAKNKMTRHQLNNILISRCWDEGRPDIDWLLKNIGLEHYTPHEIVRRTHGASYNDFIWFRFPGEEITSKDVLVKRGGSND